MRRSAGAIRRSNARRVERREAFDTVAVQYAAVRPGYPEALVDRVLSRIERPVDEARLLEVGCGPGTATEPYARRGCDVLALEPGPHLAALARERLAAYPRVSVREQDFEAWPEETNAFDAIYSATAWHHVDPKVRYRKAARALRHDGTLAVYAHWPEGIFVEGQSAYREHLPDWKKSTDPTIETRLTRAVASFDRSGCFGEVATARFPWFARYTADQYMALLGTFSDHVLLPDLTRGRLFEALRDCIARMGGVVERRYESVLLMASPRHPLPA